MIRARETHLGQYLLWALLVGSILVLGTRVHRTVQLVVSGAATVKAWTPADTRELEAAAQQARLRRRHQENALPGNRDPFGPPPPAPAPARVPRAAPAPAPPVEPQLQALFYDEKAAAVMIRIGKKESDWLEQGQNFKGWTVVEIKPASATVANGPRSVELRLK